jgi:hypothetical protein
LVRQEVVFSEGAGADRYLKTRRSLWQKSGVIESDRKVFCFPFLELIRE